MGSAGMSDQDDWDFAGPDDAKAEIRAAVEYLLRDVTGTARTAITDELINLVRLVAQGHDPELKLPDPFDDAPGG
jgi:hypothetical protein